MKKICGIYKITSPSKSVYIGQSKDIKLRFSFYKRLDCRSQPRLYNSLKKYGVEKHKFEILHQCEAEKLNELEVYYIELFQCFNNKYGLNLRLGGENSAHANETKKRMSEIKKGKPSSNKGMKMSDEQKFKISQANKGLKRSEETKIRMSNSMKGKKKKPHSRHCSQETKNNMSKARKGIPLDKKIYTFYHYKHGIVKCTQLELRNKYNLNHLNDLIKGRTKSCFAWKLINPI